MAADSGSRPREYRDVLYEALTGVSAAARDADPVLLLERVTEAAALAAAQHELAAQELSRLQRVAAASSVDSAAALAEGTFDSPARFQEAIYFARCAGRDTDTAVKLLAGRAYLETAVTPPAFPELHTDRGAVLDASTFASLWREPERGGWMLGVIDLWQRTFASVYTAQHERHRVALTAIVERIDGEAAKATALERLNSLERLGPAVGLAALARLRELERLYPCAAWPETLQDDLTMAPRCRSCGFVLGEAPPATDASRVATAIGRALSTQQSRLARRVVSRILTRHAAGEDERIDNFLSVLRASDLAGLAPILDESLVDYLRDLLEPAPRREGVLTRLARTYPEVTANNLDTVVGEFRRLLEAEVHSGGSVRLGQRRGS